MRDADSGSVAVPAMLLGAGTVVALAAMRTRNVAGAGDDASGRAAGGRDAGDGAGSREDPGTGSLWVWPVQRWNGYAPACSDGFGSMRSDGKGGQVQHLGVDVMFPRRSATDQNDRYPPHSRNGSRNHFMPDGVSVLAVRDAKVWSAGMTPRGYTVVLDHGAPWASYYTHLSEMFVAPTQRGLSGQRVRAGDVIGHVGADPLDGEGLMHLHFELWFRGAREAAIDPAPLMRTWLIAPASVSLVAST
jgi:murein DD-endopeptidase MepM/ murein hydrolase activator NlpD